ncbi:MAG TPA: DUF6596 domain-containing protein, partial [Candidatus Limnocylindrales bacterium]
EIQSSRLRARLSPSGEPILLLDQDRARWDQLLIRRGLAALERAESLGGAYGPYTVQAAIAACHARATSPEETDWTRITALYDALAQLTPSPVVELNFAAAIAMAEGPAVGLAMMDGIAASGELERYPYLHAARADLLRRLGRWSEAETAYRRALGLTANGIERAYLERRLVEVATARGADSHAN